MKKHIVIMLIIVLTLGLIGAGIWLVVQNNNVKPLYKANCEFILSDDTSKLTTQITQAQNLYSDVSSGDNRIMVLQGVISKLDNFEKDLNSYLVLSKTTASSTKKLSKSYSKLIDIRATLIKNYDEYITRMNGNHNVDGPAVGNLYNDIFNKTVNYVYKYNACFKSTYNFVFDKVYKSESIKPELYTLYSLSIDNLLNNISNNQFTSTDLITKLNNGITLSNGNINIIESIDGGEFSIQSINFQKYFNRSNLTNLINNFNTYYALSINPNVETSNEKLAVYYAKQILEI